MHRRDAPCARITARGRCWLGGAIRLGSYARRIIGPLSPMQWPRRARRLACITAHHITGVVKTAAGMSGTHVTTSLCVACLSPRCVHRVAWGWRICLQQPTAALQPPCLSALGSTMMFVQPASYKSAGFNDDPGTGCMRCGCVLWTAQRQQGCCRIDPDRAVGHRGRERES